MSNRPLILSIFLLLFLNSCIQDNSDMCSDFDSINSKKIEKIDKYHSKVSQWGNDARLVFLRRFYEPISENFELIHNQIRLNDQKSFLESKQKLIQLIESFIRRTELENWKNNKFFWILRNCLEELTRLKLSTTDGCTNDELFECLEIENELFSTLYLMGYNDQYCFNKIKPVGFAINFKDSSQIMSGIIGYDSTQAYNVVYWLNNESSEPTDSVYGDLIFVKGRSGKNKIRGIHRFSQRGKQLEGNWDSEFIFE